MTKNKQPIISYEPEADVISVEVSPGKIDYAKELKNLVVHFNKDGVPIYLEILEATKFLKQISKKVLASKIKVPKPV